MPISRLSAACYVDLELRPLPSTGVTRRRRYYGPIRHPRRPGLSLTGVRLRVTRPHRLGFPVFRAISVCGHVVVITPVGLMGLIAHGADYSNRFPAAISGSLPRHFAGSAPTFVVSRPARRSLALRPAPSLHRRCDTLSRRLRRLRCLRRRSDSYRLERSSLPGGTCTHRRSTTYHGAQNELTLRQEARERRIISNVKPFIGTLRVTNPVR
jgi:hypothetical protein